MIATILPPLLLLLKLHISLPWFFQELLCFQAFGPPYLSTLCPLPPTFWIFHVSSPRPRSSDSEYLAKILRRFTEMYRFARSRMRAKFGLTCTYFDLIAIFDKKARSATLFHYKSWLCNLVNSFLSVMSYRLSQSFVVLCFWLRKFYASFTDGAAEQGFLAFYRSLPEVRDNLIMLVLNFV